MWKVGAALAAEGGISTGDRGGAEGDRQYAQHRHWALACTIPAVGQPNFPIEHGKMEVGIGHHGEPGVKVLATRPAGEMADLMLDHVLPDLPFAGGDELAVLVSGLGATPIMELYLLYGRIAEVLTGKGIDDRHNLRRQLFHLA